MTDITRRNALAHGRHDDGWRGGRHDHRQLRDHRRKRPKMPFAVTGTYIAMANSDMVFPVRRIYCIGRNYRAHSIEMGSNPDREPPFFFQKPTDAIQNVASGRWPIIPTRR